MIWWQVLCKDFDTNELSRVYHITIYQDKKLYKSTWYIYMYFYLSYLTLLNCCVNISKEMILKKTIYSNSLFLTYA